jgi:tRNA1(Val) A37 N6-methylase TrmN6
VWVFAAAEELARRSTQTVPVRWLEKLFRALNLDDGREVNPAIHAALESLPGAIWNEPTLLGEILSAARNHAASPRRVGRAGRVSAGCVYTPASVAREIISEIHVGPRRVVDPACGPGVFLLEAFQRGYRRRLEGGETVRKAAAAALSHELAGIDIDAQALAVAEFSLRLLALRSAGLDSDVPIDLRHADALEPLPGLDGNCECIVGNPPFVEGRGLSPTELSQLRARFHSVARGKVNLFAVFVERALSMLKDGGVMAFVLPATFQRNTRYLALREVLLKQTIESIKPLDPKLFGERIVETVVLRVRKRPPLVTSKVQLGDDRLLQSRLPLGPVLRFCDHLPRALRRQIELMERHGVPVGDCFEVRDGISTGFQPFPQRLLGVLEQDDSASPKSKIQNPRFKAFDGSLHPFNPVMHRRVIDGGEFSAYTPVHWEGRYIEYDKRHEHHPPHPGRPFNCQLRDPELYDRAEKCLTRQTARGLIATIDRERYFVRNSVHVTFQRQSHCELNLDALCACYNSRFYTYYLLAVTGETGEVFPQVHIADIKRLPILPGLLKGDGKLAQFGRELLEMHATPEKFREEINERREEIEELLRAAFGVLD